MYYIITKYAPACGINKKNQHKKHSFKASKHV